MFCHRCGNQLPDGSQFCNRCGAKMRTAEERLRKPGIAVPPPRPARRYPIIENRPAPKPVEEDEMTDDEYYEEQEVRPSRRPSERYDKQGEKVIFRINQAFYPAAIAYLTAIVCSILVAAIVAFLQGPYWIVLGFAVIFFIPAIIRHMQLVNTIYILTDTKIEIESGIFSKTSRNIPLRHVLDVFVSETFKERLIGIGDIVIDTAATEAKMKLDNINSPRMYADMILDQLHHWK